jgi:hypothetical protein
MSRCSNETTVCGFALWTDDLFFMCTKLFLTVEFSGVSPVLCSSTGLQDILD